MIKDRRQKASEIFSEGNLVYATKVPFEKAFPEIENLDIVVEFQGCGTEFFKDYKKISHYSIETLPGEYIDCINPICYGGGFSIGSILREMVRTKATNKEEFEMCRGYEGSPKGRRKYGFCPNTFQIKVNIKYRDQSITK